MQTEETLPRIYRSHFTWPLLILGLLLLILAAFIYFYGGRRARQLTFEDYLDYPAASAQAESLEEGRRLPASFSREDTEGQGKSAGAKEGVQTSKPVNIPTLQASTQLVNPCTDGEASMKVRLSLTGLEMSCEPGRYNWSVTGGRITGSGREVVWDLSGAQPGIYKANLQVLSGPGCNCEAFVTTRVGVRHCTPPAPYTPTPQPTRTPTPYVEPSPAPTAYPSPVFTPSAYPTPAYSPTPYYRPSPTPTQTYGPTPAPSAYPSPNSYPSVSPSPQAYPTPGSPQRYKITVHYPDRFRAHTDEETITFDLSRVAQPQPSAGYSQAMAEGEFRLVASAAQPPVVTEGAPQVELYGKRSETLGIVRLISDDLKVLSSSPAEQTLDKQWSWRVRPAREGIREAAFTFELDFLRRGEGYEEAVAQTVWKPASPFRVPVGAWGVGYPWWLWLLLLLCGLLALLASLLLWRRPADLCIDSICKSNGHAARKRITHVSGLDQKTDRRWKISMERAVEYIESGRCRFHTLADGHRANVIVRTSKSGNKYIQTEADADHPNNLLSLPELAD